MRHIVWGAVMLASCAPPTPKSDVGAWVGCYVLTRGDWDNPPEDLVAGEPGGSLQLTIDTPPTHQFYVGPPMPEDASRLHLARISSGPGTWWQRSSDSVTVVVGHMVGVELQLTRGSDGLLTGTATIFTDMLDRAGQRQYSHATVSARVTPCPGAA